MTAKTKNLNINHSIWQHIIEALINLYLQQSDINVQLHDTSITITNINQSDKI